MEYDNSFFRRFPQMPSWFVDDGGVERKYQFPSFYSDCRGLALVLSCSFDKARAALPSRRLIPIPAGLGRAAAMVAGFEYINCQGMEPYNEVLWGIPALHLGSGLPKFGVFVKRLIVDQAENVQRGKHLWNMDKSLGGFKFFDEGGNRVCEVNRDGRMVVRLSVPAGGKSRNFMDERTLITLRDGRLLFSRSAQSGRKSEKLGAGELRLGPDPFGAEIGSLGVSARPLRSGLYLRFDSAMSLASAGAAAV